MSRELAPGVIVNDQDAGVEFTVSAEEIGEAMALVKAMINCTNGAHLLEIVQENQVVAAAVQRMIEGFATSKIPAPHVFMLGFKCGAYLAERGLTNLIARAGKRDWRPEQP